MRPGPPGKCGPGRGGGQVRSAGVGSSGRGNRRSLDIALRGEQLVPLVRVEAAPHAMRIPAPQRRFQTRHGHRAAPAPRLRLPHLDRPHARVRVGKEHVQGSERDVPACGVITPVPGRRSGLGRVMAGASSQRGPPQGRCPGMSGLLSAPLSGHVSAQVSELWVNVSGPVSGKVRDSAGECPGRSGPVSGPVSGEARRRPASPRSATTATTTASTGSHNRHAATTASAADPKARNSRTTLTPAPRSCGTGRPSPSTAQAASTAR